MFRSIWPALAGALLIAGCSKDFPETAWSSDEIGLRQMLTEQNDYDSRVELGRLYFLHNRIDDADVLLNHAAQENPKDMEAKAWLAANDCKIAGRAGPWLLGFDKLYGVWSCLSDLRAAAQSAPDNFTVAIIQLSADAEVSMFGSMERAVATRDRLQKQIETRPDAYPWAAKAAFYQAAARLEELRGNIPAAQTYHRRMAEADAGKGGA